MPSQSSMAVQSGGGTRGLAMVNEEVRTDGEHFRLNLRQRQYLSSWCFGAAREAARLAARLAASVIAGACR